MQKHFLETSGDIHVLGLNMFQVFDYKSESKMVSNMKNFFPSQILIDLK